MMMALEMPGRINPRARPMVRTIAEKLIITIAGGWRRRCSMRFQEVRLISQCSTIVMRLWI